MQKLIRILTVLVLIGVLSACGADIIPPAAIPQATNPPVNLPASAVPTARPVTTIATAFPTPTRAPSITPQPSSTAQPSLTALPHPVEKTIIRATITVVIGDGSNGCNNANLLKDMTVTDGTLMSPGQSFVKIWRFYNSGTCAWPGSTTMKFVRGDSMQPAPGITGSVTNVNNKADLDVNMVAPSNPGSYKAYFRLADKDGNMFGPLVSVSIIVTSSGATATPTP